MKNIVVFTLIIYAILGCKGYYEEKIEIINRINDKYVFGRGTIKRDSCFFIKPDWYFPFTDTIPDIPRYEPWFCLLVNPDKYLLQGDSVAYVWSSNECLKIVILNSHDYRKVRFKTTYYKDSLEMEAKNTINKNNSSIKYFRD